MDIDWPELCNDLFIPTVIMEPGGAGIQDPETKIFTKWRMPPSDGAGTSNSSWVITVIIQHGIASELGRVSALVGSDDNGLNEVPIFATPDQSFDEKRFKIQLDSMINDCIRDGTVFTLRIIFNNFNCDVAQFEIKDFKMRIQVADENYTPGQTNVRVKTQQTTGEARNRLQRLEKKSLEFSLCTNAQINPESVRGFIRREAMICTRKAVSGDTEVPLKCTSRSRLDGRIDYCYSFTANIDPEEFYDNNSGKELYTSDKSSTVKNIFLYHVCVTVDDSTVKQDVYRFTTKSKERSDGKLGKFLKIESEYGRINNLSIETLKTERGDIAYTWKLMNPNTADSYEEGDVVGLFHAKDHSDDQTFIDHLTPKNCKNAIAAGVITRSYYLNANSQQDGEKLCMVGMVKVKVSGPVKHGDFIYASNKLPGVAVTQEQLIAGKGNWREKRLLGTSLETNQENGVKLVNCIISLLLCINNDEVESVLSQLDDKIDRFRDEVSTSRKASCRRKGCACALILVLLVLAMVACYIFIWPTSFYNKWRCRRGALPGILTFHLVHMDSEEHIDMSGALYTWRNLKYRLNLDFHHNHNLNGSYYLNLRRCQCENLRRVLGWFSNPPVYLRAQVFLVNCNCTRIFHYQKYSTWQEYKSVFHIHCNNGKGPYCRKTVEEEKFHHG